MIRIFVRIPSCVFKTLIAYLIINSVLYFFLLFDLYCFEGLVGNIFCTQKNKNNKKDNTHNKNCHILENSVTEGIIIEVPLNIYYLVVYYYYFDYLSFTDSGY